MPLKTCACLDRKRFIAKEGLQIHIGIVSEYYGDKGFRRKWGSEENVAPMWRINQARSQLLRLQYLHLDAQILLKQATGPEEAVKKMWEFSFDRSIDCETPPDLMGPGTWAAAVVFPPQAPSPVIYTNTQGRKLLRHLRDLTS